jgi:hypothetical protein
MKVMRNLATQGLRERAEAEVILFVNDVIVEKQNTKCRYQRANKTRIPSSPNSKQQILRTDTSLYLFKITFTTLLF